MDELAFLMDWDLEAINQASTTNIPHFSHLFSEQDHELFGNFPEFSETTNIHIDEFDFKLPFYPLSSQTIVTNSLTIPKEHEEVKEIKPTDKIVASHQDLQVPTISKCKKSKKMKKKSNIVKKITVEDGTHCDAWAWRKYGQKPIKGSPYPRSYYKCSSSKGCLARKQVEKNHLDPRVYLVTYSEEHNHPQPTRRNSLAGSTRKNNLLVSPHSSSMTPNNNLVKIEDDDDVILTTSMKKQSENEENDLLEWLDGAQLCDHDGWIPSKELEEFIGLNIYQ